jgi:DNA-binding beta-propeller fold protein YncE
MQPAESSGSAVDRISPRIDYLRSIDTSVIEKFSQPRSIWGKLLTWVAGPAPVPQFLRPYAIAEDSRGRLIITDPGFPAVHIIDMEAQRHQLLRGGRKEPFLSPMGVAVDAEDKIYVADSERARIYVFNSGGKFLRFLDPGGDHSTLQRPTGVAVDAQHQLLYLTDTLRHQLLVLTLEGTLVQQIGERGTGPGEFNFPVSVALSGDQVYVLDAMNFRVQVLTREGDFLHAFGELGNREGTLYRPKDIALDGDGHIYVVDGFLETVQIFNSQGALLYYFGSRGRASGRFMLPSGISINSRSQIYVVDSYNHRVQVFRYRRGGS